MRWLERAVATVLLRLPNRKFAATLKVAREAGLIKGSDTDFRCAHIGFISSYYMRFFALLFDHQRAKVDQCVDVHGKNHLLAAEAQPVGAIVVSAHLGDFDAAGAWLVSSRGITPVVVASPLRPRWREALFGAVRTKCGVKMQSRGAATLAALGEDLQAGRWVLSMIDRRLPGPTLPGTLLDHEAAVPAAMAILSLRTGAPLLPAVTWRGRDGSMVVWFGPPTVGRTRSEAFRALDDAVALIEQHIRSHPEQWHVPADRRQLAWTTDGLRSAGASSGAQRRAAARANADHARSPSADSVSVPARRMSR